MQTTYQTDAINVITVTVLSFKVDWEIFSFAEGDSILDSDFNGGCDGSGSCVIAVGGEIGSIFTFDCAGFKSFVLDRAVFFLLTAMFFTSYLRVQSVYIFINPTL